MQTREQIFAQISEVRQHREKLKADIASGEVELSQVFGSVVGDSGIAGEAEQLGEVGQLAEAELLGAIKILSLMDVVPGYGKVKGRRLLEKLEISETCRVRELSEAQQGELLEGIEAKTEKGGSK